MLLATQTTGRGTRGCLGEEERENERIGGRERERGERERERMRAKAADICS